MEDRLTRKLEVLPEEEVTRKVETLHKPELSSKPELLHKPELLYKPELSHQSEMFHKSELSHRPELLAPAGSMESLYAAIQNGCDAVYLGGQAFGARASATNFSLEELAEALTYAHLYGVRIYVTANTLYKDEELKALLEFIDEIYHLGVDGVIMQDLGAAQLIQEMWPNLEIHASTQMTVHNVEGAQYLAERGFKRVVLAREMTLPEIRQIVDMVPIEVETFIHGALCICYSGQCLMSSLIGGRSGNRGRCAQPCRLPYQLVDRTIGEVLTVESESRHLLSPKDIATLEILPALVQAGIRSFKIEGRLKRPEYAASVTRIYRKYLDWALDNPASYRVDSRDMQELQQIFNRGGFSEGYYHGKTGSSMMSYGRPKNWGVKVGEVLAHDKRSNICQVRLTGELEEGDGVEIWTREEENPGTIISSLRRAGNVVTFPIKGVIERGNPVYRTAQKRLLAELTESYGGNQRKIEIFGQIYLKPGDKMQLAIWDQDGNYSAVESPEKVARAEKQPVSAEKVRDQIQKLGNMPYRLVDLQVKMEGDVFLPISQINAVRREAIDKLTEERLRNIRLPREERQRTINLQELLSEGEKSSRSGRPVLAVYLNGNHFNPENFIDIGVERIYLNLQRLTPARVAELKALQASHRDGKTLEIFAVLPRIMRPAETAGVWERMVELFDSGLDGYLLANLGEVKLYEELCKSHEGKIKASKSCIIDFPMNIFNRLTVNHWVQAGAEAVTLSPELTLREMEGLMPWGNTGKEAIVYGYLPAMISEYCPVGAIEGGMAEGRNCSMPGRIKYGLFDRMGHIFPIVTDCQNCRSTLLNPQPVFLLEQLEQIARTSQPNGFTALRMDFTIEDELDALRMAQAYLTRLARPKERLSDEMMRLVQDMQAPGFTKGHFYRGVE